MNKRENIRIPLWGVVKDDKTFLYRDKARTILLGYINDTKNEDRVIVFFKKKYDLIINDEENE